MPEHVHFHRHGDGPRHTHRHVHGETPGKPWFDAWRRGLFMGFSDGPDDHAHSALVTTPAHKEEVAP